MHPNKVDANLTTIENKPTEIILVCDDNMTNETSQAVCPGERSNQR